MTTKEMMETVAAQTLDGAKRCPRCNMCPEPALDGSNWVLSCPRHGHVAMGESLSEAVKHWNAYITYVERTAA